MMARSRSSSALKTTAVPFVERGEHADEAGADEEGDAEERAQPRLPRDAAEPRVLPGLVQEEGPPVARHPAQQDLLEVERVAAGRRGRLADEGVTLGVRPAVPRVRDVLVEQRDDALLGAYGPRRSLDHRLHYGLYPAGPADLGRQLVQHGELLDGPAQPLVLPLQRVRASRPMGEVERRIMPAGRGRPAPAARAPPPRLAPRLQRAPPHPAPRRRAPCSRARPTPPPRRARQSRTLC